MKSLGNTKLTFQFISYQRYFTAGYTMRFRPSLICLFQHLICSISGKLSRFIAQRILDSPAKWHFPVIWLYESIIDDWKRFPIQEESSNKSNDSSVFSQESVWCLMKWFCSKDCVKCPQSIRRQTCMIDGDCVALHWLENIWFGTPFILVSSVARCLEVLLLEFYFLFNRT